MTNLTLTPEVLQQTLDAHRISIPAPQVEQLAQYASLLWNWNDKLNLTRHTTPEKFVGRDLLDSLALARHLAKNEKILDVGTGGGVPGVILKIVRPDLSVWLCEPVGKKALAVADIVDHLGILIPTCRAHAQDLLSSTQFNSLVVRGVTSMSKMLEWFRPYCEAFDRLLLVKGPAWLEERKEARHFGWLSGMSLRRLESYPIPGADAESVILQVCLQDRFVDTGSDRERLEHATEAEHIADTKENTTETVEHTADIENAVETAERATTECTTVQDVLEVKISDTNVVVENGESVDSTNTDAVSEACSDMPETTTLETTPLEVTVTEIVNTEADGESDAPVTEGAADGDTAADATTASETAEPVGSEAVDPVATFVAASGTVITIGFAETPSCMIRDDLEDRENLWLASAAMDDELDVEAAAMAEAAARASQGEKRERRERRPRRDDGLSKDERYHRNRVRQLRAKDPRELTPEEREFLLSRMPSRKGDVQESPRTARRDDRRGGFGGERRDDRRSGGFGGERRDDRRGGGFGGERRDDRRPGGFGGERRDDRRPGGFGGDRRDDRRGGFGGERRDDRRPGGFGGERRDDRRGGGFGGERRDDRRGGFGGDRRDDRRPGGFGGDRRDDRRGGFGGERRDDRRGGGFGGERRDDRRPGGFGGERRDDRRGGGFGGERRDDRRGGFGGDRRDDRRSGGFGGERRDDRRSGGFGGERRDDRRGGFGGERRDDRRGGGFGGERRDDRRPGGFGGERRDDRRGSGFGGDRRDDRRPKSFGGDRQNDRRSENSSEQRENPKSSSRGDRIQVWKPGEE